MKYCPPWHIFTIFLIFGEFTVSFSNFLKIIYGFFSNLLYFLIEDSLFWGSTLISMLWDSSAILDGNIFEVDLFSLLFIYFPLSINSN